jgi:hypothetical protein
VDAEAQLEHVAVLDVLQRMLERAVRLLALVILGVKAAGGHALLVELMQETAVVALHAQAAEPVSTHRLVKKEQTVGRGGESACKDTARRGDERREGRVQARGGKT